ncbi:MAG TPA: hypothetical protein VJV78_42035 [Polyangiales bacterium]|nr:hypothetical protein [Polyangiales bacterium]
MRSAPATPSIRAASLTPARVERELQQLIDAGAPVLPAGTARKHPLRFVAKYPPSFKLELFGTRFYLTTVRQNPMLRFCIAYLAQAHYRSGRIQIYPRIFYKDGSLVWRSASHIALEGSGIWIGKGDVTTTLLDDGDEYIHSVEATTDLPLEMQTVLEDLGRTVREVKPDRTALFQLLRRVPEGRIEPYRDFTDPRRRAQADPRRLINRGRRVAYFRKANDPTSLRFVAGYEPDFSRRGVVEQARSHSNMYGGTIERYRVLSKNKRIQYLFLSGPDNAWIVPPQAMTTELSSFGVRTIDVPIDDNLCVPGYEYHYYLDEHELHSQIPAGFVGHVNAHDEARSDASPWLDQLPVIREFRRKLCGA